MFLADVFINKQSHFILIRYNIYGALRHWNYLYWISTYRKPNMFLAPLLLLCNLTNSVDLSFGYLYSPNYYLIFLPILSLAYTSQCFSSGSLKSKSNYERKRILLFFEKILFGVWKANIKNQKSSLNLKAVQLETADWEKKFAFLICWFSPMDLVRSCPQWPGTALSLREENPSQCRVWGGCSTANAAWLLETNLDSKEEWDWGLRAAASRKYHH